MKKSIIATSAAAALLSLSVPEFAAAKASEVRSATVAYGDLNLKSAAGANALYRRIAFAARKVCTLANEAQHVAMLSIDKRRCIQGAIGDAVMKVDSPVLLAVHKSKTSKAFG
jgi:UrcA family protein